MAAFVRLSFSRFEVKLEAYFALECYTSTEICKYAEKGRARQISLCFRFGLGASCHKPCS